MNNIFKRKPYLEKISDPKKEPSLENFNSSKRFTRRQFLKNLLKLSLSVLALKYLEFYLAYERSRPEIKFSEEKNFNPLLAILERIQYLENKKVKPREISPEFKEMLRESIYPFLKENDEIRNSEEIIKELWDKKNEKYGKNFKEIGEALIEDEYLGKIIIKFENINDFLDYLQFLNGVFISLIDDQSLYQDFLKNEINSELFEAILSINLKNDDFKIPTIVSLMIILNEISRISNDSKLNYKFLEFLLNRFGLNFLNCIPSLHDELVSFGPFQLTEMVIGKNTEEITYPINLIDQYATKSTDLEKIFNVDKQTSSEQASKLKALHSKFKELSQPIPTDISKLRGYQHYKANFFLILYNLILFIKQLSEETKLKMVEIFNKGTKKENREGENLRTRLIEELTLCLTLMHHQPNKVDYFIDRIEKIINNQKVEEQTSIEEEEIYLSVAKKHLTYFKEKYLIKNI